MVRQAQAGEACKLAGRWHSGHRRAGAKRSGRAAAGSRQGLPAAGARQERATAGARQGRARHGRWARGMGVGRAAWALGARHGLWARGMGARRAAWARRLARAVHSVHSACFQPGLTRYFSGVRFLDIVRELGS